jgi:hypothetical protein
MKDSIMHGPLRCCGYLMRVRMEHLIAQTGEPVGLRRATHVGALIEVVYQSHQDRHGTGFFYKQLKEDIDARLKNAHLQPQEQYFKNIDWWNKLDRAAAMSELGSNLDRLIADELTDCLLVGIELQVLLDTFMRTGYGTAYNSVITAERIARSEALRESIDRFERMITSKAA